MRPHDSPCPRLSRNSILPVGILVIALLICGCQPLPPPPVVSSATPPLPFRDSNQDRLRISSFNIRIFSNHSRNDEELTQIAAILKNYDVIAIQELRDETVLLRTIRRLKEMGLVYAYEISPPVGRGVKELYAFLYRPEKVRLIHGGKMYADTRDEFIRPPFYAGFQAGDFDFILLTVHILYGKSVAERRHEIEALSAVYRVIAEKYPEEKDIILLGDFNMPPQDVSWQALRKFPTMQPTLLPPEKTLIKDTALYDNFWFARSALREFTGTAGVNRFDETAFDNDDAKASRAVSDHRVVWADFALTLEDDD